MASTQRLVAAAAVAGAVETAAERDQVVAAPVEPRRQLALHQHGEAPGHPGRTAAAHRLGPRQRGAVRLGRIGGRQDQGLGLVVGLAGRPQAVDRAGQGELGGAETGHEVAAPDLAALLQHLEHAVDTGEAALDPFGQHRLSGSTPWRSRSCRTVA